MRVSAAAQEHGHAARRQQLEVMQRAAPLARRQQEVEHLLGVACGLLVCGERSGDRLDRPRHEAKPLTKIPLASVPASSVEREMLHAR